MKDAYDRDYDRGKVKKSKKDKDGEPKLSMEQSAIKNKQMFDQAFEGRHKNQGTSWKSKSTWKAKKDRDNFKKGGYKDIKQKFNKGKGGKHHHGNKSKKAIKIY